MHYHRELTKDKVHYTLSLKEHSFSRSITVACSIDDLHFLLFNSKTSVAVVKLQFLILKDSGTKKLHFTFQVKDGLSDASQLHIGAINTY